MARMSCLAALDPGDIPLIDSALKGAGESAVSKVSGLNVAELRKLAPDVLVADIDRVGTDPLELLRQIRFVLPDCVMIVYTAVSNPTWARACHLAGANGLLSKASDESQLTNGLRQTIRRGCFTDPRFAA
jgi:DNA-binding NarL/FixJ family response regulator